MSKKGEKGYARMLKWNKQLHAKKGPLYEKWRKAWLASIPKMVKRYEASINWLEGEVQRGTEKL